MVERHFHCLAVTAYDAPRVSGVGHVKSARSQQTHHRGATAVIARLKGTRKRIPQRVIDYKERTKQRLTKLESQEKTIFELTMKEAVESSTKEAVYALDR